MSTFVLIGRVDREPFVRHAAGEPPTLVLFVETSDLALSPRDTPAQLHAEYHAVHFRGEEASVLYRRLSVGQRLLIRASLLREAHDGRRSTLLAHTVRILRDNDQVEAASEQRRSFVRGLFERLRATRAASSPSCLPT
jgi:hypothetical protein